MSGIILVFNFISTGIEWAFRYHFGSLAFGSLIVAIVWAIRIIFEYVSVSILDLQI